MERAPNPTERNFPDASHRRHLHSWSLGLCLLAGLSLVAPAAGQAQTIVYYSVGTSFPTDLKYGTPTVDVTGGVGTATFSSPQLNNIGVGDQVSYGIGPTIVYITARTSSTVFTVRTATGAVPGNVAAQTVNSITRAFGTLTAAVTGSIDGSHLTTGDLVGPNRQLHWAMYNDGPMNDFAISITGYTTSATNYIRVFTPVLTSQVGSSQRHEGRAGTGFRFRPSYTPAGTSQVIEIFEDFVRIEGIEIDASRVTGAADYAGIRGQATGAADFRFDKLLIHDISNGVAGAADLACINVGLAGMRLSNSICYSVHSNSPHANTDIHGIRFSGSNVATHYLHNNTIFDIAKLVDGGTNVHGISRSSGNPPNMTVRNNVVLNVTQVGSSASLSCFQFASDYILSSNNVSSDNTATGAGSQINRTAYATYFRSVVAGAEDLHLLGDSIALWGSNGADLDADGNLAVTDDVDGDARHATAPDIGADEFTTPPVPKMRVKSGKYVGTGVGPKFVYVGFQPDAVFVKRVGGGTQRHEVLRTSTMPAGQTKSLENNGIDMTTTTDMILSFGTTGFTVGADPHVNESGFDYHWVAFKAAPGDMVVNSYSGDGATLKDIAVGFKPDYVIVMPAGSGDPSGQPVWTTSTFPTGESFDFDATYRTPGAITGLSATGFQVGRGNMVVPYRAPDLNVNTNTYHYIAWNAVPGRMAVGTYLGNSPADNQSKNVTGFFPEWVLIKKDNIDQTGPDEKPVTHKPASTGPNTDNGGLRFSELTPAPDTIQRLLPLGFEIGADDRVNNSNQATCRNGPVCTYHWVAFGPHEPQINYRSIGTAGPLTNQGTITLTVDSRNVTASGVTGWLAASRGRGDRLSVGGQDYMIERVVSDSLLILSSPAVAGIATGTYTIARQYATLQAWENCISFNNDGGVGPGSNACTFFPVNSVSLVDDDRTEIGIAYKDSVFNAGVRFNGLNIGGNTDATHTITLTADPGNRHFGIPGNGVQINNGATTTPAIEVFDDHVTVEWMEIFGGAGPAGYGIDVNNITTGTGGLSGSAIVLRNNLIHGPLFEISIDDPDTTADVYNNILYSGTRGLRIATANLASSSQLRFMNNTIYNCGNGFDSSVGAGANPQNITLINNLTADPGNTQPGFVANSFAINGASRNNLSANITSNDATASSASPGGGAVPNQHVTNDVDFVNSGAGNLHILPTSTVVDNGVDLSSLFAFDIDFAIRQSPWDIGADDAAATTEVKLQSFGAVPGDQSVLLEWRTASELQNLGFHVYRGASENGPWARLTSSLIPGLGSSAVGQTYSFRDAGLTNGTRYFYRLEDVDASSKTTSHGPVSAVPTAGASADDSGGKDKGADKKKNTASSSCPDWVLSAYASAVGSDAATASLRCTRHGDPEASSLGVLSRDSRSATLELRTGGFYALHEASGTVRVFVPGFDFPQDEKKAALPIRRALTDAVVGRRVQLGGVRALDLVSFKGLVPSSLGKAEMQVGWDGTVRAARRSVRPLGRQFPKSELVSLLPSLFQGEQKSAVVEIAPLRFDAQRQQLVLAKRVRVRLLFTGREVGESGRGSLGRSPGAQKPASGEILARLYTTSPGLYSAAFEQLFPGQRRGLSASQLRLERQGEAVGFHLEPSADSFGPGSRLYFHADKASASTDFTAEVAYELIRSAGGVAMPLQPASPDSNVLASASVASRSFETNRFYQPGLLEAPDLWLWEGLTSGATRAKSFELSGVSGSGDAELDVLLQGGSESGQASDHHVRVTLNGTLVGEAQFAGKKPYRVSLSLQASLLREGSNELQLTNVGDTGVSSLVFLDRFTLAHPQASSLAGGRFEGTWSESGTVSVAGLSS
jgi:hypothetical protein